MSNDGNNRVQELFLAALEIPAEKRDAWLVEQCGGDERLLDEVRSLLAHDNPDDDPLERGLDEGILSGAGLQRDPQQGLRVRCPHCHHPIELVDGADLSEVVCGSCGSSFSLLAASETQSYRGPSARMLAHFKLVERVGIGAFGSVFKAQDTTLDRIVAIKVPRKEQLPAEESEKFLREARMAAQLRHPNIVSVHEVGRDDDRVYIVSDFVDGLTLSDWLTGMQPTPQETAELCITIARALHHAHERGVIHRDLKPGNIMLDRNNVPHLMDFGLAKREAGEITMTIDGQVLGTPAYMSPEQARGEGHDVDPRTDIYALGVILFEMLTGERPFRGNTRMLLHQVLTEEAPSPRRYNTAIPKDLETICLKCLEKSPARRYDTAAKLAADLERYLNREPITARPVGHLERGWRWVRRYPARAGMSAAVTIALLLAVGFGVGLLYQGRLETANSQLEAANEDLSSSLKRERELSGKLQTALGNEESARQIAEQARASEVEAKEALDRTLYFRRVNLALAEWKENEPARARQLLAECPPEFREWEWHYASRICNPELMTFNLDEREATTADYSSDGQQIVTSNYISISIWDANTGALLRTFSIPPDFVTGVVFSKGVVFSPDDQRIAGPGRLFDEGGKPVVFVWNAETGEEILRCKGHLDHIERVAFSPDGQRIASASRDHSVRIWDANSGKQLFTLNGHTGHVVDLAYSPDGTRIASGSLDKTVRVWDANTGEEKLTLRGHRSFVNCVTFSPDNRKIVSTGPDNSIKIWDANTGRVTGFFASFNQGIANDIQYSPDGSLFATVNVDRTARIYNTETGIEITTLIGHEETVGSVDFAPDSKRLVTAGLNGEVKVWSADLQYRTTMRDSWENFRVLPSHVSAAEFSADGKWLAVGTFNGLILLFDAETMEVVHIIEGHSDRIRDVAFSADGQRLASASEDGGASVWDPNAGTEVRKLEVPDGPVFAIDFSPGSREIATAHGNDGTLRVWDATTGEETRRIEAHARGVTSAVFSPDGRYLATAGYDDLVRLWDTKGNYKPARSLAGHLSAITCVAFSPDARLLVTGCVDNSINVWRLDTGELLRRLQTATHHRFKIPSSVAFSPNGRRVATTGNDKRVCLWDVDSGQHVLIFGQKRYGLESVTFSPDGNRLIAGGKSLQIYDARPRQRPDELSKQEDAATGSPLQARPQRPAD